jgi:hypothetical protein
VSKQAPSHRKNRDSKISTMAEIEREYPDEWILLEITRDNRDYRRVAGRLLAHSPDRSALDDPYERFRAAQPQARVLEVFTGDIVPEGVVVIL